MAALLLPSELSDNFAMVGQDLSEVILGTNSGNLMKLLNEIPARLGLTHLAYMRVAQDMSADVAMLSAVATYPKQWLMRYLARDYAEIDPIFAACGKASSTFDWRPIRESSPQSAAFFADAADHGVGSNGVTIPVPAMPSGYGMVSFNSDLADADWDAFKLLYMGKLDVVACLIHSAASRNARLPSKKIELSRREHQALSWAARGKTASEIAEILEVSYSTARSHLEGARRKLACENVTHAVATALAIGLIPPMALRGFDPAGYSGKDESERAAEP